MAERDDVARQLTEASRSLVLSARQHVAAARDAVKRGQALITESMETLQTQRDTTLEATDAQTGDLSRFDD
jgi:hypothetical protein